MPAAKKIITDAVKAKMTARKEGDDTQKEAINTTNDNTDIAKAVHTGGDNHP